MSTAPRYLLLLLLSLPAHSEVIGPFISQFEMNQACMEYWGTSASCSIGPATDNGYTPCQNPALAILNSTDNDPIFFTCGNTGAQPCPDGTTPDLNNPALCVPGDPPTPDPSCTSGATQDFTGPYNGNDNPTLCGTDNCLYSTELNFASTTTNTAFYTGTNTGNGCEETTDGVTPQEDSPVQPPEADAFPTSGCLQDGDGEVWCTDTETNSPPLPNNGNSGVPAQPDGFANDSQSGDTFNFFDNSTTNNSTNFSGGGTTGTTNGPADGSTGGSSFGGIDTDGDGEGDCDPSVEDCGTSQVSGGLTCSQPPQCNGDPIFCAIRFQAWSTRCNLESDVEDISETDVMEQIGQTQTIEEYFDPANNPDNTIDIQAELTLDAPTVGSCPADLTANAGKFGTITIPSDILCDVAAYISPIFIALAYLISGLMIHNSIVRDM